MIYGVVLYQSNHTDTRISNKCTGPSYFLNKFAQNISFLKWILFGETESDFLCQIINFIKMYSNINSKLKLSIKSFFENGIRYIKVITSNGRFFITDLGILICMYSVLVLGVPYGTAERFQKPTAYGNFKANPQIATSFGDICAQVQDSVVVGSEDCLNLNIYAPVVRSGECLKVKLGVIFSAIKFH